MKLVFAKLESMIRWIGEKSSYLNVLLILVICVDVVLRYIFNNSKTWVIELEWHLFALIFLLGSAYTLQEDKHVRVDIWYAESSPRTQAITNLVGTVLFLIPWCLILIHSSYNYAANSWMMHEGSPNPGGLPARYLIKFSITICFILLLLQGLATAYHSLKALLSLSRNKI